MQYMYMYVFLKGIFKNTSVGNREKSQLYDNEGNALVPH